MANLRINKPEAARRQIDVAVRMILGGEDVVACATLAGAGYRIVRDIAKVTKKSAAHEAMRSTINPGMEGEFWKVMNSVPNFLGLQEVVWVV